MPKEPKFKRGFTWRHHLDEWWDRRPQEWKARLLVFATLGGLAVLAGSLFWVHRWTEKNGLVAEAKRIHQNRIKTSDSVILPKADPVPMAGLRDPKSLETRPAE